MFLKIKLEKDDKWKENYKDEKEYRRAVKEKLDIELGEIKKNPGLRFIAKICLNSLWGKFGQRKNMKQTEYRGFTILRSDNGTEYVNNEFNKLLDENGIKRQFIVPRTPQQNGTAERMNQTLLNTARCILLESGIPISFWVEAVNTACCLRNKCSSKAISNKIPEDRTASEN
ncbi:igcm-1 [Cordylochernes scorpioides]|uniref:DNA-directed DNA polymerase n=1 Tax=Cordylochernes scorpioides TaxID=51811 RepID=A0ABY6LY16_9ARAC|nr:igcm-1 [Cordylochernes scorpioides]